MRLVQTPEATFIPGERERESLRELAGHRTHKRGTGKKAFLVVSATLYHNETCRLLGSVHSVCPSKRVMLHSCRGVVRQFVTTPFTSVAHTYR